MMRAVHIHLNPTPSQQVKLQGWLDSCRNVYNACLEQRISAYKQSKVWPTKPGKLITRYGQCGQLPQVKEALPEYVEVNAAVLQDVTGRVDKAFQAFFKRNKVTKTGGFPRFKSHHRFNSFTHPQASWVRFAEDGTRKFYLPTFGWLKYHKQGPNARPLTEGTLKTVTVKRLADGWWASFSVDYGDLPLPLTGHLPSSGSQVGLDVGLSNLVTLHTGEVLGTLDGLKKSERKLRVLQQSLSAKKRGSTRRRTCLAQLDKANLRFQRGKDQKLHEISKRLVRENDVIVVEDLNIKGLLQKSSDFGTAATKGLHRNIGLASWGRLAFQLDYKAEEAGRQLVKVDPRHTSQMCSGCGVLPTVKKDLSVRQHRCPDCGLVLDRDHNAALNILRRGLDQIQGSIAPACTLAPEKEPSQYREVGPLRTDL